MPTSSRPEAGPLRGVPESAGRSVWRAASFTGAVAAAAGAVLGTVVAVVCWLPDAGVSGHPLSAVRAGLLGFLAAQHAGLSVDSVPTSLAPLLGLAVVVVILWRSGATLAEVAVMHGERRRSVIVCAGLLQAAVYAAACVVLVPMSALGSTSARAVPVAAAAFGLAGSVGLVSLVRSALGPWHRLPPSLQSGARGAAGAIAVYLGSGAVLVAASLLVHADQVMQLSRQVGGGLSGLPVAVLGALFVPNATVAGAAYLAGPGFAVGSGTSFDAFSAHHGVLPAFPLLGALPSGQGASGVVVAWMLATTLVAGFVAFRLAGDDGLRGVAMAVLLSAPAMAVLTWLGGGGIGAGRLSVVGASPWRVGLAVAAEIAIVTLLLAVGRAAYRRLPGRYDPARSVFVDDADLGDELATVGSTDDE